jgi:hypothetical protein
VTSLAPAADFRPIVAFSSIAGINLDAGLERMSAVLN